MDGTPTLTPRLRPKSSRQQSDCAVGDGEEAVVPLSSISIGVKRSRPSVEKRRADTVTSHTENEESNGGMEWSERRLATVPMVPLTIPFTVGCVSVNERAPTIGEAQQMEDRRKRLGLSTGAIETTKTTGEHKEKTHRFYLYVAPTASFHERSGVPADQMDETLAALFYAMVDRVEFVMNPSFPYRRRVCTSPPFVIQECAWGESMVDVIVYLRKAHLQHPNQAGLLQLNKTASSKKEGPTSMGTTMSLTSPPDAALPIKASKVVKSFIGTLNLKSTSSSRGEAPDELLYYVPLSAQGGTSKSTLANSTAEEGGDNVSETQGDEEVHDVDVSGLNDTDTHWSTYLMSDSSRRVHAERLESTVLARIRTHLQRPVVDSRTHPALPSLRMVPNFSSAPLIPSAVVRDLILASPSSGDADPASLVLEDGLRSHDAKFVNQLIQTTTAGQQLPSTTTLPAAAVVDGGTSSVSTANALRQLAAVAPVVIPPSAQSIVENMDRVLVFEDRRDAPVVSEKHNAFTIYCSVPSLVNRELSEDYSTHQRTGSPPCPSSPKHKASAQLLKWAQQFLAEGFVDQQAKASSSPGGVATQLLPSVPRLPAGVRELITTARDIALRTFASINIQPPAPPPDTPPPTAHPPTIACPAAAHLAQYILRLMDEERELVRRFVEVDTVVSDLWEPMAADLITSIAQQLRSETE